MTMTTYPNYSDIIQWNEHIPPGQVYNEQWWQEEMRVVLENHKEAEGYRLKVIFAKDGAILQWRANDWIKE